MNRREAFKRLGFGMGALIVTPSVISLLQSCQSEPDFIPVFLGPKDGKSLLKIVGLIIPSDQQIPGAKELGIYTFVDAYWKQMLPEKEQNFVRVGFTALNNTFTAMFGKEMHLGTLEEFDQLLTKYLKSSKEQQIEYNVKIGEYMEAVLKDSSVQLDRDSATFAMLSGIRGLTIRGWKLHEEIGKNVLWYNPIPGEYQGCIPADEAGNGNIMTLES